jgi:hypothetical protein
MPTTDSPFCRPVTATVVHSFCGEPLLKETSLFVSVSASSSPMGCVAGFVAVAAARPWIVSFAMSPAIGPTEVATPVVRLIV